MERLTAYGLENARLEPWHFGRGWTLEKLTVEMVEPRYLPLIGYADAWSPSTSGEIAAPPLFLGGKTPEQVDGLRSATQGRHRYDRADFDQLRSDGPAPAQRSRLPANVGGVCDQRGPARPNPASQGGRGGRREPRSGSRRSQREGEAGAVLKPSRGEHGTVFVSGRDTGDSAVPSVTLAAEHYNMIARMLQQNIPVELRINVQSKFYDADGAPRTMCSRSCLASTPRCATKW